MADCDMMVYTCGGATYRLVPVQPAAAAPAVPVQPAAAAPAVPVQPAAAAPAHVKVPAVKDLLLQISDERVSSHASKSSLTKVALEKYMRTLQISLDLKTGVHGQWSQTAQSRLHAWLQKPRRTRMASGTVKAEAKSLSSDSSSSDSSSSSSSEDEVHSDG
jgi:hypothetical protein